MKELTVEDKAKFYEEALERARIYYNTTDSVADAELIELIFPELKESEDEKIRKELIAEVKERIDCIPAIDCRDKEDEKALKQLNKWLVWLKKQDKQDARYKYLEELLEADTIYQMAMNDAMVEEAKTKALEAISNMEISKLLGLEKQDELIKDDDEIVSNEDGLIADTIRYKNERQGRQKPIIEMKSPEENLGISSKEYKMQINDRKNIQ